MKACWKKGDDIYKESVDIYFLGTVIMVEPRIKRQKTAYVKEGQDIR